MNYEGTSGGILTFKYDVLLPEGNHEVIFYAKDTAGNLASKTVKFSIKLDDDDDDDGNTDDISYDDGYTDELYFDQFIPKKVIYLEEEDEKQEMTWWQKFIAWLKKIFGLN